MGRRRGAARREADRDDVEWGPLVLLWTDVVCCIHVVISCLGVLPLIPYVNNVSPFTVPTCLPLTAPNANLRGFATPLFFTFGQTVPLTSPRPLNPSPPPFPLSSQIVAGPLIPSGERISLQAPRSHLFSLLYRRLLDCKTLHTQSPTLTNPSSISPSRIPSMSSRLSSLPHYRTPPSSTSKRISVWDIIASYAQPSVPALANPRPKYTLAPPLAVSQSRDAARGHVESEVRYPPNAWSEVEWELRRYSGGGEEKSASGEGERRIVNGVEEKGFARAEERKATTVFERLQELEKASGEKRVLEVGRSETKKTIP